jgi:hypothetical protein
VEYRIYRKDNKIINNNKTVKNTIKMEITSVKESGTSGKTSTVPFASWDRTKN